jgi:nucleotide-binding universal stress UspA family protein
MFPGSAFDGHKRRLTARGLAADTLVVDAEPSKAILEEARRGAATLVVMSTHGLGRLIFGSTALDVLQRSPVPLMLIHARVPAAAPVGAERDIRVESAVVT